MRRGGVRGWHRERGLTVPAEVLSDDQWARVAPLLPKGRKRTVRRVVDGLFEKSRTAQGWNEIRGTYGSPDTMQRYFRQWTSDGTWERVLTALADCPQVAVPELDLVPPLYIEGRIDPRPPVHLRQAVAGHRPPADQHPALRLVPLDPVRRGEPQADPALADAAGA